MHNDVTGGEQLENAGPDGNDGPGGTNGNTGSPSQREPAGAAAISVSTRATGKAFTLAIGNVTAISTAQPLVATAWPG